MKNTSTRQTSAQEEITYKTIFEAAKDGIIILDQKTGFIVEVNSAICEMHGCTYEKLIGLDILSLIDDESKGEFTELINSLPPGGTFDSKVMQHVCKEGSKLTTEWSGSAFVFFGRLCLLGIIRDITKRIQAEKLLQQRVETRTNEQAKLLEISHTLASTMEFQPSLILKQLREIIHFNQGGLFSFRDSAFITLAMLGTPQLEESAPFRINISNSETLGFLFNNHKPIRIADLWSEDKQAIFFQSILEEGTSAIFKGMQSWMWVPLAVRGRIIGGIGVASTEKNYFSAHMADLALSVSNQAAITMINAELYGQAKALAVLEERQSLARNLHDAVNQSLFSAGLIAEVLPRLWIKNQEDAQKSLEDLRRLTRGAQAEMRALLAELRPTTITDSNLSDLILLLGDAFTGRTSIPVIIDIQGEYAYPPDVQIVIYRICQEALSNIAKHAKASEVKIRLLQADPVVELQISDNGKGFDPNKKISGHYGLGMMHERAESIGAVLLIESQLGYGSKLTLRYAKTRPGDPK